MIKNKNILITGGGGFIGSHLCEALVENNKITLYDNGRRNALRYTQIEKHPNLQFIKGDILNYESLKNAIRNKDIVVHLAAIAGVSSYYESPLKTMEVNLLGTYHALKASSEMGVKLFLNCSTSEVYGPMIFDANEGDLTHQGPATIPRWSYAVSKLAGDHLSFSFRKETNLPVVVVRPFNIYGPRQIGEGAIQHFAKNALRHNDLIVRGDGTQIRSWCYVSDCVNVLIACLSDEKAIGNIFNIGNPASTISILELAKKIKEISHSKSKIVFQEHQFTDVRLRVPSIKKAQEILGYRPKVDIEEGLMKAIEWYKEFNL
ncbi:MAG: epimerase [Deltaproteobacteria bacterium RIFCSPHIGHO2_02_FULL_40_11]|nr:MAG: epimerase [Deltaproteobacteria bacterium RIFCSPHIGHO2_02_FULL_40_11]